MGGGGKFLNMMVPLKEHEPYHSKDRPHFWPFITFDKVKIPKQISNKMTKLCVF